MSTIGEKIRARREELGLTQERLAEILGYKNKSSIAKIEAGAADVPRSKVDAFASALSLSPEVLMGWPADDERREPFAFFLEQQINLLGWAITYDPEDAYVILHEGRRAAYEITEDDVVQLERNARLYLAYLLQELAGRSPQIGGAKK